MAGEELVFLPLGGAGEIGMNLNLYGYGPPGDYAWVMVDLGITFGDGTHPGVDVIMPDPAYIEAHKDKLAGLVLTHAHEDHLGAVPYLWERLECPIYATAFTISILKRKLADTGFMDRVTIHEVPLNGSFNVGPFEMDLITLTHSIPEPNAIAIKTPLGTVVHTGDWKLDPDPVIGEVSDMDTMRRLGDEGVLAIVCDSTNVFTQGTSGSEGDLLESLTEVIGQCKNRVAVTSFASNVARLDTIARAAAANGRDVVAAGRSIERMVAAAKENGYLQDTPAFLGEEMAGFLPRDKCLVVCTGSQGEPRAALSRIAAGEHPRVSLDDGDTVIFSSRVIPGNEVSIGRLQNRLVRRGIEIITDHDHFVHVSGHPARDELVEMYQAVKPEIAIPVHGELRHLAEHARLAKTCQVAQTVVNENGSMVRIAPGPAAKVEEVTSGRLTLEGNRVVPLDGELVRGRARALFNGSAVVTLVIDKKGELLVPIQIATVGLVEPGEDRYEPEAAAAAENALSHMSKKALREDDQVSEAARIAVRRYFRKVLDKNAVTRVHLVRM
ncbi:MAG: ribonuclease J [Rhodospirillaceae bacterium]|nr:ribonuclease J [Rhodospirillaceae bacterium]